MKDRQTRGQACCRESGGRGADTLAPLPLSYSPAVILCLGEPSTSLLLLLFIPSPHPRPLLRSHSPPSSCPLAGLKALISTLTMPKHFHEQGALEEKTSF